MAEISNRGYDVWVTVEKLKPHNVQMKEGCGIGAIEKVIHTLSLSFYFVGIFSLKKSKLYPSTTTTTTQP